MFDKLKKLISTVGRPVLVAGLGVAFGSVAVAGGGGDPGSEPYGDNPNHKKGSRSGSIRYDCTNFSFSSAGVLTADCNVSLDPHVDPVSTSIDLSTHLRISYTNSGRILMSNDTDNTWDTSDNWTDSANWFVGDACSNTETYYESGWVLLRGDCRNEKENRTLRYYTNLSATPGLGGLQTSSNGRMVLK